MKKGVRWLFLAAALGFLPPTLGGWIVQAKIQNRIQLKIKGTYLPIPFSSVFYLRNAQFSWDDRIQLLAGHLKVSYDFRSLAGRKLRVRLSSRDLNIRLLGGWAEMEGVGDAHVRRFYADLGFGPKGIEEIFEAEVDSPAFQFRIQKTEN